MVTTAIWLEVLSSYATSFLSNVSTCSGVSTWAKSLTSFGGLGRSGIILSICANALTQRIRDIISSSFSFFTCQKQFHRAVHFYRCPYYRGNTVVKPGQGLLQ